MSKPLDIYVERIQEIKNKSEKEKIEMENLSELPFPPFPQVTSQVPLLKADLIMVYLPNITSPFSCVSLSSFDKWF